MTYNRLPLHLIGFHFFTTCFHGIDMYGVPTMNQTSTPGAGDTAVNKTDKNPVLVELIGSAKVRTNT